MAGEERCELCGMERATWFYPAQDVQHQVQVVGGVVLSVGAWIVCDRCQDLAEQKAWAMLLERQAEGVRRRLPMPGPGEGAEVVGRIREAAKVVQALMRTAVTGPPQRRARAPQPPGVGGDLDAYRRGWLEVWRQAPAHLVGDADGRAAQLLQALRSWGIEPAHPQVTRCLWGMLAVAHHDQVDPELTAALSAVLSSLEVGS